MPVVMNDTEEKMWNYLLTHKTPVHARALAKHYLMSEKWISAILKKFYDKGIVDVVKVGTFKYYKIKE